MGFAKAASALLSGIAPRVTDTYTNAANATAGYARGLGDAVQAPVDQTIANHNAFLTQTGAPQSALEHSAPVGNTAYGLEGYIPASTMQREGAAFSSAAQMLPSDALARGQQAASASLNDTSTIAKLQSDLAKIAATRPQVYQQMLNTLSEMGYRQGELTLGQERINVSEQSLQLRQAYDKASLQFRYAGLKLSNQKFAFDVQQAMAKGQMPDSALSGKYGYIVDSYGNPILNGKGRRIPVVRAGKGKGGLPGAGGDLASKLGLSQNEYFSWLGKAGKDAHYYWGQGSTWKQALGQLVVLGIPKPIAIKALRNQGYMPGVRGAPPISPGEGGGKPGGGGDLFTAPFGAAASATESVAAQKIVGMAHQYLGTPYVWGGESPKGFDCSGFAEYLYAKAGISIPRTTYTQWTAKNGHSVPPNQLEPGDLVFFRGSDSRGGLPGHVGVYIGGGQMIDAPHTGASVRVESVQGFPGYMGARRYG